MSTWREHRDEDPGPRPVRASLDRVVRRFGGGHSSAALTTVFARWADIAGAQIAAHARPRSLAEGVLVIVVDDPAWATQLTYLTTDLARRCRECTGDDSVTKVEVRVAGSRSRGRGREKGSESAR